ncbi:LuxR family transcriptional regulator [Streptomyces sp. E5N91]|uniref:helix-turn-helix transcriptional regulator n=1 Tax=Streptomyces sp. E5N91 TaxID=1851996 RepID=UPI001EE9A716|nr:LuxR family transcriptional regulator [Streptomyces sp. E5N91]
MESHGGRIIGREKEQRLLSTFATGTGGGTLILRGETGVGKSVLLDHVTEVATRENHRVLRAAGVEAESDFPFAGLHQVLYPLLPGVERLDEAHRTVLDVVFGGSTAKPPSVMTLAIAVLDLLSLAASKQPILLVLDDGQWLDAASAEVCAFAGRRLTGSSVRLVIGLRSDTPSRFDTAALSELPVLPLQRRDAELLLDTCHPGIDAHLRQLVLKEAEGNPLALLELPPFLADNRAGRGSQDPFGYQGVPLPRRLQHVYGTRIRALGPGVRAELLKGALDGVPAGKSSGRADGGTRYRMVDAEEAALNGLLDIEQLSGAFVFRHPLVRSTVVQMATPNERRAAHAALARVHRDDLERRATHLAASTVDPDEKVASQLEAAAHSATRRGGALSAVTWLTRAAELSENREDRSRRLGDAAFIAGQAALLDQAQRLVHSDAVPGGDDSPASVIASAYTSLYQDGDVRFSRRQVAAAIAGLRDSPVRASHEMLSRLVNLLLAICQYASDPGAWQEARALIDSLAGSVPPKSLIYRDAWSDVVRHGKGVCDRLEAALSELSGLEPWDITRLGVAAYHVDTLGRYRPHLQRTVDREVETGATSSGMTMLHLITLDRIATGEWDEAERSGKRALELANTHDHALFAQHSRAYLALLAAMRGRLDEARELQATVDAWARPRGIGFLTQIADAAGTTAALSEGDYETAYLYAIGITAPGTFEPYAHQASRTLLDLVEAAVHTGRSEQARTHALAARRADLPGISPRLALITYGALSMTAEDDAEATEMYERAEASAAEHPFPFELARIRLAHGIRLRHSQGPRAARETLSRAAEAFERLGAPGWSGRAGAELRAAGSSARPSSAHVTSLTWQERRIADLAAGGLTNKEIGERMHLSPRTVSSHLYRVFPKLSITSRAALRDALGKFSPDEHG